MKDSNSLSQVFTQGIEIVDITEPVSYGSPSPLEIYRQGSPTFGLNLPKTNLNTPTSFLYAVTLDRPQPGDFCLLDRESIIQAQEIFDSPKGKIIRHESPLTGNIIKSPLHRTDKIIATTDPNHTHPLFIQKDTHLYELQEPGNIYSEGSSLFDRQYFIKQGDILPRLPDYFVRDYLSNKTIQVIFTHCSRGYTYPYLLDEDGDIILTYNWG